MDCVRLAEALAVLAREGVALPHCEAIPVMEGRKDEDSSGDAVCCVVLLELTESSVVEEGVAVKGGEAEAEGAELAVADASPDGDTMKLLVCEGSSEVDGLALPEALVEGVEDKDGKPVLDAHGCNEAVIRVLCVAETPADGDSEGKDEELGQALGEWEEVGVLMVEALPLPDAVPAALSEALREEEPVRVKGEPEEQEDTDVEALWHAVAAPEIVALVETVVLAEEDTEREVLPLTNAAVGVSEVETLTVVLPECEVLCVPEAQMVGVAEGHEEAEVVELGLAVCASEGDTVTLTLAEGVLEGERLAVRVAVLQEELDMVDVELMEGVTESDVVSLTHAVGVLDGETLTVLVLDWDSLTVPDTHPDDVAEGQEDTDVEALWHAVAAPVGVAEGHEEELAESVCALAKAHKQSQIINMLRDRSPPHARRSALPTWRVGGPTGRQRAANCAKFSFPFFFFFFFPDYTKKHEKNAPEQLCSWRLCCACTPSFSLSLWAPSSRLFLLLHAAPARPWRRVCPRCWRAGHSLCVEH